MKIAVLVVGEYREFKIAHKFWPFMAWPDIDCYVATWDKTFCLSKDYPDVATVCETVTPKDITDFINVVDLDVASYDASVWLEPSGFMIDRWQSALTMMKQSNIQYDRVILIRTDIALDYDEDTFKQFVYNSSNSEDDLYGITGGALDTAFPLETVGQMSDLMLMGTQASMLKLLNLPTDELLIFSKTLPPNIKTIRTHTDIHAYLAKHCSKMYSRFMNMPIPRQCIIRSNCRELINPTFSECKLKAKEWWERYHRTFYDLGENTWTSRILEVDVKQVATKNINLWDRYDLNVWPECSKISNWLSPDSEATYIRNMANTQTTVNTYGENDIQYIHNSHGFRCSTLGPREFEDADNYPSLLVGGCSITEGIGLPEHHIWHSFLTVRLAHHAKKPIVKFNLGKGGRSIDAITRYVYTTITHKNVVPDLVYLLLPPITRQELIIFNNTSNTWDLWPHIIGNDLPDTTNKQLRHSIELSDQHSNYRSMYNNCFRNLLMLKLLFESKNIPWFFSFWGNDFDENLVYEYCKPVALNECTIPVELRDNFIDSKFIPGPNLPKNYSWPFEQTMARDFMHEGPNSHFSLAGDIYDKLLSKQAFINVMEKWGS